MVPDESSRAAAGFEGEAIRRATATDAAGVREVVFGVLAEYGLVPEPSGTDADLADLSGADLGGANLHGAKLSGVNLQGAKLNGTNLTIADLWEANLKGADLTGAILNKTDLSRAIWTDGRICADSSVGECK